MNFLTAKKGSYLIKVFLLFYLIIGIFLSTYTGISTDEFLDQYHWQLSLDAIKDFFGFNDYGYDNLLKYEWKYHGVGFHYLSHIYINIVNLFVKFEHYSQNVSDVLIDHTFIFIIFFLSGIISKKIVYLLIKDDFFSNVFLIFYLLYPYLLGHGFYNPKDMPFLFTWLLCTYINLKICIKIYKNNSISILDILYISLATSFLFSIRISGILILMQYISTFLITLSVTENSFLKIMKLYLIKILLFILFTTLLTLVFYPIFWVNPLLLLDSINQMRSIPYGVCTLTLGNCMDALNLPSSYILIWLFFKIPILILIGLLLFPFVEKKIFLNQESKITLGSLIITLIGIIFLLIFFNVNLYDELRHILFVVPLILLIGFSIIYFFSRKITIYLTFLSIIIFGVQNINMYPYQYTWLNPFSNLIDVNEKFELDYWGVSGKNIANKINKNNLLISHNDKCIYVSPKHIFEPFISRRFGCVKTFTSIYPKSPEKYILVKYTRNIRRENPSNCKLIFDESYKHYLISQKLVMGEVYFCN